MPLAKSNIQTPEHLPGATRDLSHPYYQDSNSTTKLPASVLMTAQNLCSSPAHGFCKHPAGDQMMSTTSIDLKPLKICFVVACKLACMAYGPCCDPAAAASAFDEELCLIFCGIQRACRCCWRTGAAPFWPPGQPGGQ